VKFCPSVWLTCDKRSSTKRVTRVCVLWLPSSLALHQLMVPMLQG
jgi:hypothetical protein